MDNQQENAPAPGVGRHDGLWKTLTLLSLALTASVVNDLGRRFSFDGIDLSGALVVALPTLASAISAGSVLSESLRARVGEIYEWQEIAGAWHGFVTAAGTAAGLVLVTGLWLGGFDGGTQGRSQWERPEALNLHPFERSC